MSLLKIASSGLNVDKNRRLPFLPHTRFLPFGYTLFSFHIHRDFSGTSFHLHALLPGEIQCIPRDRLRSIVRWEILVRAPRIPKRSPRRSESILKGLAMCFRGAFLRLKRCRDLIGRFASLFLTLDPVSGEVFSEEVADDFGALSPFDACRDVQLLVDFASDVQGATIPQHERRFRRLAIYVVRQIQSRFGDGNWRRIRFGDNLRWRRGKNNRSVRRNRRCHRSSQKQRTTQSGFLRGVHGIRLLW